MVMLRGYGNYQSPSQECAQFWANLDLLHPPSGIAGITGDMFGLANVEESGFDKSTLKSTLVWRVDLTNIS